MSTNHAFLWTLLGVFLAGWFTLIGAMMWSGEPPNEKRSKIGDVGAFFAVGAAVIGIVYLAFKGMITVEVFQP